jgi:hypothetical protein
MAMLLEVIVPPGAAGNATPGRGDMREVPYKLSAVRREDFKEDT